MNQTAEAVTPRQRAVLQKLMLSPNFTAEEAHRTAIWLNSPRATKDKATEMIDKAQERIKNRDDKAAYHAQKDEYPPRRYSNEHPPPNGKSDTEDPPTPAPTRKAEQEQKIYQINSVDDTDKTKATEAVSKDIFG